MNKKAVFFSTDALFALIVILATVLVVYPMLPSSHHSSEIQADVVEVLSTLKVGEIDNSYVQSLILSGDITNLNNSILEQIGEFYITNKTLAVNLANSMLNYLNTSQNIGIWFEDSLIASRNSTPFESAENIEVSTYTVSGLSNIEKNGSVTGYSARAWLSSNLAQKYFYFGGYTGDGNISIMIDFAGQLNYVGLEIAISNDFDIYINGNYSGHYENSSSEFSPSSYDLSAYNSSFHDGENTIRLVGNDLYIAGGFFKIVYESFEGFSQPTRYYFPGIEGLINLYDGFYIPGQLNNLDISLHLDSNYDAFLNIGNVTVFSNFTSGEETILINNSELSSMLDYSSLSQETIPLRLGLENATYIATRTADVFSTVELSGSMNQQVPSVGKKVLELVKEANEVFIYAVMNSSANRLGFVGYGSDADDISQHHNLSRDENSLNNTVQSWSGGSGACTCCGIIKSIEYMEEQSDPSKYQSIVLMSDGKANTACWTGDAKQDAIDAACDAYYNHSIIVNVIGFGPTTTIEEDVLKNISECGNGTYYYANATDLAAVYQTVAKDIEEAAYKEQTVESSANVSGILYPDSYIEFNYTKEEPPYGLITVLEQSFHDYYYGDFIVPNSSTIIEARAISYSGPRWTDRVDINNLTIYNLSYYGEDYTKLGDPYFVQIPTSYINELNTVRVSTGTSPENSTSGSENNKIIYTLRQNASSYSEIVALAEGCTWELEFEDSSETTLNVPAGYSSSDKCYYKSSGQNISNDEDAVQLATMSLLSLLDKDNDGMIDVRFTEQNLEISASEITGIPYIISTEVQVRRWI